MLCDMFYKIQVFPMIDNGQSSKGLFKCLFKIVRKFIVNLDFCILHSMVTRQC